MFDYRASLAEGSDRSAVPVRITLLDRTSVSIDEPDVNGTLSKLLGRTVTLEKSHGRQPTSEEYRPVIGGLDHRDTVTDFGLPEGTFFDSAVVHVLTTATLARLARLYPQGSFDSSRFPPNLVMQTDGGTVDFVENGWIGRELGIGNDVRLTITGACGRCMMTTLPQGDLSGDIGILRTAAQHNGASVGVYATVVRAGIARPGDSVALM